LHFVAILSIPLLAEFERETIGIGKEGESFSGELIDAHLFDSNSPHFQSVYRLVEIVHGEREMAQSTRLRIGSARGRLWKRKQLDLAAVGKARSIL
jgi:hypothetical protein